MISYRIIVNGAVKDEKGLETSPGRALTSCQVSSDE